MEALGWTFLGEADHGGKMFVMRGPFSSGDTDLAQAGDGAE